MKAFGFWERRPYIRFKTLAGSYRPMTAETYMLYAPLTLLGFGAALYAVLSALRAEPRRELKPIRVVARRRDVRR